MPRILRALLLVLAFVLLVIGVLLGPVNLVRTLVASGQPLATHQIFRAHAPSEVELPALKAGESRALADHAGGTWSVPLDVDLAPEMSPVRLMIESTRAATRVPRPGVDFNVYLASDTHTLVGRDIRLGGVARRSPGERSRERERSGASVAEGDVEAMVLSVVFDVPEPGPYKLWVTQPGRDPAEPLAAPAVDSVRAVFRKNAQRVRTGVVGFGFVLLVIGALLGGVLAFLFGRSNRVRRGVRFEVDR